MSNQKSKAVASTSENPMESEYTCSDCSVIFTTQRPYFGDYPKCIQCRNGNYKSAKCVCIDCNKPPVDRWNMYCSDCNQRNNQRYILKHGIKNETITYQCEVRNVKGKKYYQVSLPYEEDTNEYSDYKCPTADCESDLLVSSKQKHNQKIIMELQYDGYMDSLSGFRFILTECYCGCCYSKINHTEWEEE